METGDAKLVSARTMEIAVAIALVAAAGVVIADSLRLGVGWREAEGPTAGYFPFYVGVFLGAASLVNLARAWLARPDGDRVFVTRAGMRRVLAVLLPFAVYVIAIGFIGIYVASAIYVALFMWWLGRYAPIRSLAVGLGIATTLFLMFEVWFLVPLPKGPIEQLLGY